MSVYTESARAAGAREDDEVVRLKQETEDTDESYGPLKALCEDVVRGRFANAFVPRPGLIIGPGDPTGRFTYWPTRFAAGGSVLAPSPSDAPVQLIDARVKGAETSDSLRSRCGGAPRGPDIAALSALGEAGRGHADIPRDCEGSIDATEVRGLVEEILEGGREAFEMRRLKYGF